MGQRHQIYMATPAGTVGIHHQWLYGRTAGIQAIRMMRVIGAYSKGIEELTKERGLELLKAIYTVIPERAYYHNVCELGSETGDPLSGDNNDGITVFDFRDPSDPKYCFVSINGLEGAEKQTDRFDPLSVEQYVRAYYPKGGEWQKQMTPKDIEETEQEIKELVEDFNLKVMSLDELFQIFPTLETAAIEMVEKEQK